MVRLARNLTRKSLALLTSLVLVLFWVPGLIAATPASASTGTLVGGFEIDGNLAAGDLTPTSGLDWNSTFAAPHPTGRDAIGTGDSTVYSNGTQDADPVTGWNVNSSAGATGKGDIGNYYVAHRVDPNNNHDYAFFAIERDTNQGTVNYDVELDQHADVTNANGATVPCRAAGDVMLNVAQQGNNSFSLGAELFTWSASGTWTGTSIPTTADPTPHSVTCSLGSWHDAGAVSGSNMVGTVNSVDIQPIDNQDEIAAENGGVIPANQFAEFAFDLTGTNLNTTCPGAHFGAINIRSVASTGGNPEVKDFVTGPINILPACADLTIHKYGPDGTTPLGGATFTITPNPSTGTGTLTVTDGGTNDADNTADGFIEFDQAKPLASGGYSVHEDTAPTGYLLATPRTVTATAALAFNSYDFPFTDPLGSITFKKVNDVTGLPLGGATFHITPNPLPGGSGSFLSVTDNQTGDASSVAGTIKVNGAMVGTYTISESDPPTGFVADPTTRTAVVGDPQLDATATANPVVTSAFRDPTVPSITAVKSSDPASGTVANPTPVSPGQTISYTIAVSNSGSSAATGVTVTDAIPTGTTYVAGSADHGGTLSSGSLSWTIDVPGASTVNLHFQVTVDAADVNGTLIDNTAAFSNVNTPSCVAAGTGMCSTNTTHHKVVFPIVGAVKSSDPASGTVANPAPVSLGQTISYTIAVSNTGLADATGVVVTDAIPTGTTYVAGSADHGGVLSSGSLSWTIDVAAQSSVSLHFQVTVDSGDVNGTLIDNTAVVNGTSTNTTHHEVKFPVISAVKSSDPASGTVANPTPVSLGQTISYTIAVSNTGLADALAVPVTDVIPAGTTYVAGSADHGGTLNSGTLSWSVDVAAQSSVSLHFQVTVDSGDANGTLIDNTATVNGTPTNTTHHKVVFPIISAVKSSDPVSGTVANPTPVSLGQTITYTIAVSNSGLQDSTGVTVTDAIPTGTTYVAGSADHGGALSSGSLSWTIDVAAQSSVSLHFQVTVDSGDVNGTLIDNTAVVNGTSTNTTHHEVKFPIVSAVKSSDPVSGTVANPTPVSLGQTITYTIAVSNTGLADATGVAVTDAIPAGTTYVAGSADHGGALSSGSLSWTVDVAAQSSVSLHFQVTVDAGDVNGTLIDNTAVVNGTSTNTTHHEVTFPIVSAVKSSDPASGTVANPTPVNPNQTITYTIAVSNSGLADALAVPVTDVIPAGTTYVAGSADHGGALNSGTLSWSVDVAAQSTVNLHFQVTVDAGDANGTLIDNTATVNGTPTNTTHHKVVFPIISAVKSSDPVSGTVANPTPVSPGQTITYTIAVSNSGLQNATGVTVTDAIPTGTTYVAGSADHGGALSSGSLSWTIDVAAQSSVSLHFQVTVNAGDANGTLIDNTAVVNGTSTNTTHHEVKFPIVSAVKSSDPVSGTVANPTPVSPGQTITYTIAVSNTGLADAHGVTVADAIPAGTTYVAASADHGGALSSGSLSWTIDVAAQSTVNLHFQVTVNAGDANGTLIDNTAVVNGTSTNTTHHEVTFPIVGAVKSSDPASGTVANPTPVSPGQTITYTIAVSNTGLADAHGVTVTDAIPTGTTYVAASADHGGALSSGSLSWTIDVAAQSSVNLHFQVTVDAGDANGTLIDNTAVVNGTSTNTTHHEVTFPIVGAVKSSDPVSGTAANPTPVKPGQTISYTIVVSNTGLAAANAVPVTDAIPAGTTYVAGSADNGGTLSGASLSWTINVAAQSSVSLHFQVTVNGSDGNGTLIDNTANVNHTDTNTTHHEVEFSVLSMAKTSNPVSGSIVQRGDKIDYTITITNAGLAAAPQQVVTDTLPDHVTVVAGSASPAFTTSSGNTVTWTVDVPAGTLSGATVVPSTTTLTYSVTVDKDAPEGATLTNVALINGQCVGSADQSACTTDHHVPTGALTLVKHVNKSTANYGDTLTYTFDASTTGSLNQTNVTVTDVLPKDTTYVNNSAGCTDAGTCTASYSSSTRTVTWQLGSMAAGTTRHLVFKVSINTPTFDPSVGLPPKTILNSGVISSTDTASTPSNVVKTTVVAVLGVKVIKKKTLPFTGLPAQTMVTVALLMLGAGITLTTVRRRREN